MNGYEQVAFKEMVRFENKFLKRESMFYRGSKQLQQKINAKIPNKIHDTITTSVKAMVESALWGSEFTSKKQIVVPLLLEDKEKAVKDKLKQYRRTAVIEGVGTGAGGLLIGLTDFPLLLSIKIKFLFEAAAIYGFRTTELEDRLFLLYIFQLAFSSDEHKREVYTIIKDWENKKKEVDWRVLQQEYRDYLDVAKLLQLVPGIGAVVGGVVNRRLLDHLGEVTIHCFRLRYFNRGIGE